MKAISQSDEETLLVAVEAVLLDLRHRWMRVGAKERARLRRRDPRGRPTTEAEEWLVLTSVKIQNELMAPNDWKFVSDPVDYACFASSLLYLAIRGGLPANNLAAHFVASTVRELEEKARRHLVTTNAVDGGRSRARAIRPAPLFPSIYIGTRSKSKPRNSSAELEPAKTEATVTRQTIESAIRATPHASTAELARTVRAKLTSAGIGIGPDALRMRIERLKRRMVPGRNPKK